MPLTLRQSKYKNMKYKLFGAKTGLHASEIILGAANFGTRKGYGADPEESKKILTAYAEAGGNFIDISDVYQFGEAEEIALGLQDLVSEGKIVYAGLSNFPAWKASAIASATKLTALQIEYNLLQRTADRELIPMATEFGLGVMMYSPLAGGMLTAQYRKGEAGRISHSSEAAYAENEKTKLIIDELVAIAEKQEATPGQIAFAWNLSKEAFPLLGARNINQFEQSLKAAEINLTVDELTKLDALSSISLGYPHDLLNSVRG